MRFQRICGLSAALATLCTAGLAAADSGIDTPEGGVAQVGRGGAWVARADDPLAAYYNPAALAFQATSVHVGAQLMFQSQCLSRLGPGGTPVSPGGGLPAPGTAGGPDASVCNGAGAFPNPGLAANFRLSDRLAIGIAVVGPHAAGKAAWPESVSFTNKFGISQPQPAAQRYLLISSNALIIDPTISVSYAVSDKVSFGVGFIWGIASAEFVNFTEAISPRQPGTPTDNFKNDVRARLNAKDLFIPGVVLGALWQASGNLDLAGWFKWQDALNTSKGDLHLDAGYWQNDGKPSTSTTPTDAAGVATLKVQIPMEARLGVRFHQPREGGSRPRWAAAGGRRVRDPMSEDLFDLEADFTWANNSAVDALHLQFLPGIQVKGTTGTVPVNGDIPHQWKDSVGVRLGGDVVVMPNRLSLRAGGFYETRSVSNEYLTLDFIASEHAGLAGGGTLRLGAVDVSVAFQHTFYGTVDNGGNGLIHALSGDMSSGSRSQQVVNGGKLTASLNEIGLGGTLHF